MKSVKDHNETHIIGDVEVVLLWKSFLGFNFGRQLRIYRNGVWIV